MTNKLPIITPMKFNCYLCNFECSNKKDYSRHILTRKHHIRTNTNKSITNYPNIHLCECGKKYKHASSLWNHKQKCNIIKSGPSTEHQSSNSESNNLSSTNTDLAKQLIPLIKDLIIDIIPVLQPNHTDNSKTFNINMFLNEQCKDAMNMTDFIESIQLSLEDMKHYGDKGQTNGMANILIDKLNTMEIVKRPVHCSDIKKEIIYVKDDDKWEKEEKHNPKIKSALDTLTKKSIQAMPYMENNPDEYVKTISEVLKDPREDNKIISQLVNKIIV